MNENIDGCVGEMIVQMLKRIPLQDREQMETFVKRC